MTSMFGNTLQGGGASLIYVRSRRPILTMGLVGVAAAIVFGALAAVAFTLPAGAVAGLPLGAGALGGVGLAAWAGLQLQRWPAGKLALFRDRLVVIHGNHEMRAPWTLMETITLAVPAAWPEVRLTDRLPRPDPPPAGRPEAARPPAGVRFRPRPGDLTGGGR